MNHVAYLNSITACATLGSNDQPGDLTDVRDGCKGKLPKIPFGKVT